VPVEAQVTTGAREEAIGAVRDADVVMDGEIISSQEPGVEACSDVLATTTVL
jgi:hypothetical protein